jgi:glutaredoxin
MRKMLFCLIIAFLATAPIAQAFVVDVFTKPGCSACEDLLEYLNSTEMRSKYPNMQIALHDVTKEFALFNETAARAGFPATHVPVITSGRDYKVGFVDNETNRKWVGMVVSKASNKPEVEIPGAEANLTNLTKGNVTLQLFWVLGCPHCAAEERFLETIAPKYPELQVETYEVSLNETSRLRLLDLSEQLGFETESAPVTVLDGWYHIGYEADDVDGAAIEAKIKEKIAALHGQTINTTEAESDLAVNLPLFGRVDLREMGIPLSTVIIGLMDGFNPCAFFVLTMLLSFMVYARSRGRMLVIGLTFVFISGLVYFLFMTAMFSAIRAINEIRVIALVGGAIAIAIGMINLKDFFFFKKGISLTIPESRKPKLYKRMRDLLKSESLLELWVSTVILAFVANSYELLCTAGFPIAYGSLLNTQQLDVLTSVAYIALYNVFYVMPLLAIVLIFVKSLGGRKLTEEQGELLKSVSGIMMLGFGAVLITSPRALSNVFVAIGLILLAIVVSLVLDYAKKRAAKGKETKGKGAKGKAAKGEKETPKPPKRKARRKRKNEPAKEPEVQ